MAALVDCVRGHEPEGGDFGIEHFTLIVHHLISPLHDSEFGPERTKTGVLERLIFFQPRLISDYTRPLYLLHLPNRIGDMPVSADQRLRRLPFIGNGYMIGEEKQRPVGIGPFRDEFSLDNNTNPLCYCFRHD